MTTIAVPTRDEVSSASQILFDQLKKRTGKVANLYATMGYSSHALQAFLDLEATLAEGIFSGKEREAIALIVSETNSCAYCLAGHTALAIKRGFTKEQTLDIRRGHTGDAKLDSLLSLTQSIAENQGHVQDETLDRFFRAGYNKAALMELTGLVALRVFTNYVFALTNVPVDFPAADPIHLP